MYPGLQEKYIRKYGAVRLSNIHWRRFGASPCAFSDAYGYLPINDFYRIKLQLYLIDLTRWCIDPSLGWQKVLLALARA